MVWEIGGEKFFLAPEAAEAIGISRGRMRQMLLAKEIPEAIRVGDRRNGIWLVPVEAVQRYQRKPAGRPKGTTQGPSA